MCEGISIFYIVYFKLNIDMTLHWYFSALNYLGLGKDFSGQLLKLDAAFLYSPYILCFLFYFLLKF